MVTLANNWIELNLNQLIDKVLDFRGKTPLKIGMDWGGGDIPALSANNVQMGKINLDKETYYGSDYLYNKWMNKGDVARGEVIMTMEAPLGNVAQIPDDRKYILSQRVILFKTNNNIINNYFKYSLMCELFQRKMQSRSTGTTALGIKQVELMKLSIPTPPLPEQKAIAEILTTIDNVIEKTEALIEKQKNMKAGLMQDLFTRGVLPDGSLRPTWEEAPELYQQSELGWIPMEWEVDTILSFTNNDKFAIVDGPFGSNLKTEHYRSSGVQVIQSGFVTGNTFIADEYLYVDREKFRAEIRSKVDANDIVMAKIGAQCGTCAILPKDHPVSILAGNCLKITVSDLNSTNYMLHLLHYYYSIGRMAEIVSTTAQPAISMSSLKIMNVIKPNKNEQLAIAERIDQIERNISNNVYTLDKLTIIKQGLMDDLLTGKVRVTELIERGYSDAL